MASSNKSIYAALAANLLIALTKFMAGFFSNSAAMVAEGVHSVVDTANQVLLLFGLHQSRKKPDAKHPFGYGKELYFYSFIVSILIFGLGGGVSIYQGIAHIITPEVPGNPTWNYAVLGMSVIFEGSSLLIAAKEFNKLRGELSWWQAIVKSKDPSTFLVLFEDSAAVIGLVIVAVCMFIGHTYHINYLDGLASLLVGLVLIFVSIILARESRSLLMGEGIGASTKKHIIEIVEQDQDVLKLMHLMSTYQSPTEVLLMLIISFKSNLDTAGINNAIIRIRNRVKDEYSLIHFVIIQPDTFMEKVSPNMQLYV
ncbi:cation diffusion facilitator family transporter [Mucilaginibacter sp. OK283]|jgi:cation diffusion facilitator family transporter|uniref:cation diffusion facilitator family transporter n=1 Tax=Mucilaginibacter sp. OK283 TaxID=1881049 RepID=UPI0008B3BB8A|nr:cation diffusion facilitator family transporter [Mucilaginibacter sp. OK283]SEP33987.1 cation diffusion facilitator family transporter [Mucilaginibacter sp. OK283]